MPHGDFNENNWDSWYFKSLTLAQSTEMLRKEKVGAFLVRDSARTEGAYVLCVKEEDGVAQYPIKFKYADAEKHYYIREESSFPGVPQLLSFYKRNLFKTTPLVGPVKRQRNSETPSRSLLLPDGYRSNHLKRNSDPAENSGNQLFLPVPADSTTPEIGQNTYARVIQRRVPNAYDDSALRLETGDIIRVTKKNISGKWEGVLILAGGKSGRSGHFPFTHVDVLKDFDPLSLLTQ